MERICKAFQAKMKRSASQQGIPMSRVWQITHGPFNHTGTIYKVGAGLTETTTSQAEGEGVVTGIPWELWERDTGSNCYL